jgi:hypothetical protein
MAVYSGVFMQPVASASAHVKGSYLQAFASTAAASDEIYVSQIGANGNGRRFLMDVATGAAGSEAVKIANMVHHAGGVQPAMQSTRAHLPISIPASTRIAVRIQSSTGSSTIDARVHTSTGTFGDYQAVQSYGPVTSTTRGLSVDTGAVASTKGSYVELVSSTGVALTWIQAMASTKSTNTNTSFLYNWDVATGAAASEVVLLQDLNFRAIVNGGTHPSQWCFPLLSVAASTRLAARGASGTTNATNRVFEVTLLAA